MHFGFAYYSVLRNKPAPWAPVIEKASFLYPNHIIIALIRTHGAMRWLCCHCWRLHLKWLKLYFGNKWGELQESIWDTNLNHGLLTMVREETTVSICRLNVKMDAADSFETLVTTYETTKWFNPEDYNNNINVRIQFNMTLLNHAAEPFSRSCQLCSYWRTSQHFMKPEC
jgi:hypothetical protein